MKEHQHLIPQTGKKQLKTLPNTSENLPVASGAPAKILPKLKKSTVFPGNKRYILQTRKRKWM